MLDWRALLIAALLVASAIGAYVAWSVRTRSLYAVRSLSAAPSRPAGSAQPLTHSLHVDGCEDDFIVKVGELVEPRLVPGASLEQARLIYGPETKRDKSGITTWERDPYTLTEGNFAVGFVHIAVKQGHVVETLDGVDLGIDSFAAILRKMRDKKVEVDERVTRSGEKWTLDLAFQSACGRRFLSEYSRSLDSTPEVDRQIAGKIGPDGKPGPLRPDVFLNKVVFEYTVKPAAVAAK